MSEFTIIDGKDKEKRFCMGIFDNPQEAIDDLNKKFKANRFKIWLKNGSAILEEKEKGAAKELINRSVKITGKGMKRVAKLGQKIEPKIES